MISRITNFESGPGLLGLIFTLVLAMGLLGYIIFSWLFYLVDQGHYLIAALLMVPSLILIAGTVLRATAARMIVFGSALICGAVYLSGYGAWLLP